MINIDAATLKAQFQKLHPLLEEWGKTVDEVLNAHLASWGFSSERVQRGPVSRVKDEESFIQKALYRGKNYTNPILDITDKVGTRVVMLNIADVGLVSDFIRSSDEWTVVEQAQDIDYIREHDPTEFKYQSNHFVVKPVPPRYTEEICNLLTCEIQVRTLLQHAYAETSHDTVYKKGHSDDPKVIRSLAVTMAFLETADEKIKYIYENTQMAKSTKALLIELISELFRRFVPTYSNNQYDAGMSEAFLSAFPSDFQDEALNALNNFVTKDEEDIHAALTNQPQSILFQQPIILLAFYAIRKKQNFTLENWPFTEESLRDVLRAMNISEDVLQ